jgi:hypothetical protein
MLNLCWFDCQTSALYYCQGCEATLHTCPWRRGESSVAVDSWSVSLSADGPTPFVIECFANSLTQVIPWAASYTLAQLTCALTFSTELLALTLWLCACCLFVSHRAMKKCDFSQARCAHAQLKAKSLNLRVRLESKPVNQLMQLFHDVSFHLLKQWVVGPNEQITRSKPQSAANCWLDCVMSQTCAERCARFMKNVYTETVIHLLSFDQPRFKKWTMNYWCQESAQ